MKAYRGSRDICGSFRMLPEFAGIIYRTCTMNKETYIDILRRLSEAVRRKRPQKWRTSSWFLLQDNAPAHGSVLVRDFLLLQDNAPAHGSVLVRDFLANKNVTTPEHHPYPPDQAPAGLYLFPRLKGTALFRCS